MFTGIVEEVGTVAEIGAREGFRTLRIGAARTLSGLHIGSSIAVNGVCLTARAIDEQSFTAELSRETIDRTSLGDITTGSIVNLERPMAADGRFDGHLVLGHVDGTGTIHAFDRPGDNWRLEVEFPEAAWPYIVDKGSIAVDGISLTVAGVRRHVFGVAIIPHTLENTNLKAAGPGDRVNLEFDIIAKYVERMIQR